MSCWRVNVSGILESIKVQSKALVSYCLVYVVTILQSIKVQSRIFSVKKHPSKQSYKKYFWSFSFTFIPFIKHITFWVYQFYFPALTTYYIRLQTIPQIKHPCKLVFLNVCDYIHFAWESTEVINHRGVCLQLSISQNMLELRIRPVIANTDVTKWLIAQEK